MDHIRILMWKGQARWRRGEQRVCCACFSLSPDSQCSKKTTAKEKRQRQERVKEINKGAGHSSMTLATFLQQSPCELPKAWRSALPHRREKKICLPWLVFLTLEKWLKGALKTKKDQDFDTQLKPNNSHSPQSKQHQRKTVSI